MRESQPGLQKQPIAIIGLGCRFPGGCDSPASFWDLMAGGADGIVPVPAERWNSEKFFDADEQMPSRMYIQAGGFLRSRIDQFDSQFFGLSPREAALLDPQQRLLLEVAWEAMEDAGLVVEKLAGSSTGVYIGGLALDNMVTQLHPDNLHTVGVHTAVSTMMTMLSNRLSYTFDLRGPSMSIDTACSSSLVAVHQACQAIWNGECQQALVGGVNVMHRPEYLVVLCKGGFLARDGRCKSFDDRADGYGRGEGAGIAVLKPYADALRDGDRIYAVIRGTGVNQDGRTDGITVPNPEAQEALVRRVMADAGVKAQDLSYVEAHGTGTAVGDPLETSALAAAIGRERDGKSIPIGSVKANIGHLEAAAGIAGFIKSALVLSHRQIPPLAQLGTPNSKIPFQAWNLRLPTQLESMEGRPGELFVGINSFGYGGTNAHVVLQDLPEVPAPAAPVEVVEDRPLVLPISARSAAALKSLAGSYADLLEQADPATFHDLCSSAALRRDHHDHRVAVVADSIEAMRQQLLDFRDKGELVGGFNGTSSHKHQRPVFVFTGMGPQWWAMGRELYTHEPIFKAALDDCNVVFKRTANWDVLAELLAPEELSQVSVPHVAACTNFLLQVGLVTLWRSWGIEPGAVVGHSLGEVGAAWGSGALDLESAIDVLYHRSRLLNQIAGQGTMASVNMSAEAVAPYLAAEGGRVSIAAINSPKSVTLTGDTDSLKRIAAKLEQIKVSPIFMQVQMAYHSAYMEPLKEELYASLKHVKVHAPHCEVYSSVTGTHVQPSEMNIDYWWHNMREPVYFAKAIDALIEDGHRVFLEVGPQPVLSSSIKHCLAHRNVTGHLIASLRRTRPERVCLGEMVALLYGVGASIRWEGVYPEAGRYLPLPTYPWQRETCWHETDKGREGRVGSPAHPLLGERVNVSQPVWESRMINGLLPYLVDHHVQGLRVLAGACYAEQGLALHASLDQGGGPNVIENMQFHKAFVIEPHDEPVMHVSYDEALRQYEVRSRTRQGNEWRLHARGELSFLKPVQPAPVALAPIQARCTVPMNGDEHYRDMTGRGLEYGPYFRGVQQLWRDESGDEVIARVEGREALADRPGAYRLHPALLDAVLQTLLTTLGSKGDNEVYIPVQIRRLVLHASPTGGFWCNARLLSRWEGGAEGEVVIFDDSGQVIAEVQGVRAQALTRQDQASDRPFEQWLYEFQWQAADAVVPKTGGRWVVLEDKQGLGIRLARELRQAGVDDVLQLPAGMDFDRRLELLAAQVSAGVRGVVFLGGLDAGSDDFGTPAGIQMIRLIQLLSTQAVVPELIVVTREAQRVHPDEIQPNVAQATLIGGVRVANNEYPNFSLKAIDIDGQPSSLVALAREILSEGIEDEIALRGKERHVHRLRRSRVQDLVSTDDAVGRAPEAIRDPAEHEVRVALRRIRVDAGHLHVSVGEVEQLGRAVDTVQVGDQVLVYVSELTATAVTLPAARVFPIPAGETDPADLAVFAQAACALSHLHRQIGAQVVVTGAASGLGRAAIAMARRQGMTVFALVENGAQARALSDIADARIIDASAGDAVEDIRRQTEGGGVDLVIDLLSGEVSQKAATLLAPFGRFVSLSDKAIVATPWLQGNRSAHRIDMPSLVEHQPALMGRFWQDAAAGFQEGALSALPRRSMPQPRPHELQSDPILPPDAGVLDLTIEARSRGKSLFEADASYLITGGFGGFGLEIAAWMVDKGARHLVLVGRRGANTPEAQQAVQALEKAGARVLCAAADVSLQADVIRLIDDVRRDMPVLRGVFHTAAVLQDSPINQILPEHVHAVMNPKAAGGWYLHQYTQDLPLDYFVLFSSVAGLVGGPGQASYAMSCEYQDALARHRRALGLPAISINWGALAEVGMIARHGEVAKYFSVTGVGSFSPAQAVDMLGKALAWNPVHIGMAIMDWKAWGGTYPAWSASPKYVELVGEADPSDGAQGDSALLTSLRAMPEEERRQHVEDLLCSLLAQVSQMPTARIDRQASLINLGLDSLMAMELQMAVETSVAVKVSTLELMKGNNLVQLSQLVATAIMDKGASSQAGPAAASEPAAQAVPSVADQVKALLDDEVDELLLQLLADEQVKEQA